MHTPIEIAILPTFPDEQSLTFTAQRYRELLRAQLIVIAPDCERVKDIADCAEYDFVTENRILKCLGNAFATREKADKENYVKGLRKSYPRLTWPQVQLAWIATCGMFELRQSLYDQGIKDLQYVQPLNLLGQQNTKVNTDFIPDQATVAQLVTFLQDYSGKPLLVPGFMSGMLSTTAEKKLICDADLAIGQALARKVAMLLGMIIGNHTNQLVEYSENSVRLSDSDVRAIMASLLPVEQEIIS